MSPLFTLHLESVKDVGTLVQTPSLECTVW